MCVLCVYASVCCECVPMCVFVIVYLCVCVSVFVSARVCMCVCVYGSLGTETGGTLVDLWMMQKSHYGCFGWLNAPIQILSCSQKVLAEAKIMGLSLSLSLSLSSFHTDTHTHTHHTHTQTPHLPLYEHKAHILLEWNVPSQCHASVPLMNTK